jgi:PAB-dependent poly(A)-specific ribonuclease subunit 3
LRLMQLDAGSDEKIMLMSRDEQSCLVVSYRDLRTCIEAAYNDLARGTSSS